LLISHLKKAFPEEVKISGESTGLHLIAEFGRISFDEEVVANIKKTGFMVHPVNEHALEKKSHTHKLILGYSHLSHPEIVAGVAQMKKALIP
jgi:GntR family transcriptional regulator/MocR family aminotransferase